MYTPDRVEMPAPNLSWDQLQEGITQGLYREFETAQVGYTIYVILGMGESVEAVAAYIADPPNLAIIDQAVKQLADNYLTIKACYEALPTPPLEGPDPWATLRPDYLTRMHAAQAAMEAAGGPV